MRLVAIFSSLPIYTCAILALIFTLSINIAVAADNDSDIRAVNEADILNLLKPLQSEISDIRMKLDTIEKEKADRKKAAKEVFERAVRLSDSGKMDEASFYYAIACASDPYDGQYLYTYVKSTIGWADNMLRNNQPEAALRALEDMLSFLYSSTPTIPAANADSAAGLIKDVSLKITETKNAINRKSSSYDAGNVGDAITEAERLLDINVPSGLDAVESYISALENAAGRLMRISGSNPSEQAKNILKAISQKIDYAAAVSESERLLAKGTELIGLASNQRDKNMLASFAGEASLIGQRLSLSLSDMPQEFKSRVGIYADNLVKLSSDITLSASELIFAKLNSSYDAVIKRLKKNDTNAEKAIAALSALQDDIIVESSKITDINYLKNIRGLLSKISSEIELWREIQVKRYERWAISVLKKFNDTYKSEMGMMGSGRDTKNRIYFGMKEYLCPIEARYLGATGFRAYSEVFDFFYKELDRDQRLELSAEFMNCEKKALKDF